MPFFVLIVARQRQPQIGGAPLVMYTEKATPPKKSCARPHGGFALAQMCAQHLRHTPPPLPRPADSSSFPPFLSFAEDFTPKN